MSRSENVNETTQPLILYYTYNVLIIINMQEYAEFNTFDRLLTTDSLTCSWDGVRDVESCNFLKSIKLGDQARGAIKRAC